MDTYSLALAIWKITTKTSTITAMVKNIVITLSILSYSNNYSTIKITPDE
jgi:hypothetical protein